MNPAFVKQCSGSLNILGPPFGKASLRFRADHLLEATTGKLRVRHFNGSWSDLDTWNAITAVNEKVWMAVVYNGATSFKVYKNGAFVQEITLPNAFVSNTQPLSISGVRTSAAVGGGMAGNHDEFVWFNYKLTGGQLAALFEES